MAPTFWVMLVWRKFRFWIISNFRSECPNFTFRERTKGVGRVSL